MQFAANKPFNVQGLNLQEILQDLFIVLNDREQSVIVRRFALGNDPKETLEAIGQDFDVTRERVRQIESLALKKLRRTCPTTAFNQINELAVKLIKQAGGIITQKQILSELLTQLNDSTQAELPILKLSLDINPDLKKIKKSKHLRTSWHLKSINTQDIKTIIQTAIKILKDNKDVIKENEFIKTVQQKLARQKLSVSPQTIVSAINSDRRLKLILEGYGLTRWRHVEPKSIRDKALIVLRRHTKPLHFVEIANRISEANFSKKEVTTQAVHNELIRYNDFVLVGRGLYALKEWGYKKGTVKEVITDILSDAGKAMQKQDIISAVLERRHVKVGTISLNLQKYDQFERVGRALYKYNSQLDPEKN